MPNRIPAEGKYNFIDLFAGAGGLSEGFIQAGFNPIAHVEMNSFAAQTLVTRSAYYYLKQVKQLDIYYQYLRGEITRDAFLEKIPNRITKTVICETMSNDTLPGIFKTIDGIMKLRNMQSVDVVIGGPPCQAYSLVGRAQSSHMDHPMSEDPRNELYKLYARVLKRYQPRMFVFENVMGISSANEGTTFKNLKKYLRRVGYEIEWHEQNSKSFGVLQNRRRMIIVGWLKNSGMAYPEFLKKESPFTVNDLLSDLPKLKPGLGSSEYRTKTWSKWKTRQICSITRRSKMAGYDNNKLGELRPNQIITTFGPGAIVDAVKDSVTVLDINYWKEKGKKIIDGRLASYLGVDCFYMPRTSYSGDVPVISFPTIHVCSNLKCGRLFDARDNFDLERYLRFGVTCPECHKPAYPSRFITICENGHMDDFPWSWWVHRGMTNCKGKLKMYSTGNTSTLADMWIECELCGAKRSMSGATQEDNFSELRCSGHHPFRPRSRNERCDKKVIPSQRGASNVYFSVSRSAISIPPWVNPLYNLIDEHLHDIELLKDVMGDDGVTAAYNKYFADNYTRTEFDEALTRRLSNITEFKEIKQMEYDAITHHNDPAYASNKKHFKAEEDSLPAYLKPYFSRVIRITRLREVKVLLGFTRVDAPDPDADVQANVVYLNKGKSEKWLPAAEVNGEGVFIEFNKETLEKWLAIPSVKALSRRYEECYEEFCNAKGWTLNVKRNATYVLMHTFAHLLIKQMAMTSGYSSSAIRERIYFSEKMTGILLYTGSADKEGSLGGLVELGNIGKLVPLMKDAFQEALLCTNDPECMSNAPAGNNLNGAACHSCCMISETACENGNRMLDRGLVVPIACRERESYFRELVCELCQLEM